MGLSILSVDDHISLTHSGGKPYVCDQCKYSSKMAQNLKAHKLTHSGEKPCDCDRCKYSSKTAQNLKTHKLTHSGEKPYACDYYKYSSTLAQALKRHKLTLGGERHCHSEENCLVRPSKENYVRPKFMTLGTSGVICGNLGTFWNDFKMQNHSLL